MRIGNIDLLFDCGRAVLMRGAAVGMTARDLTALDMKGDVAHHLPLAKGAGDVIDPQAGRARGLGRRGCRGLDHIEG